MRKRDKIIFCFPASLKKKEQDWIKQQPELQLLADLVFLPIPWKDEITGTENEWKQVLSGLASHIGDCAGVVIWAPEQSLLSLSGYLQMSFDILSIPIVLFSAPTPSKVTSKIFLQLGLKSVLINATYLALSDIAEVVVLAGSNVYRPDQCYWEVKNKVKQVNSNESPLASVHFQLTIHKAYHQRSKQKTVFKQVDTLTDKIDYLQWYPGLSISVNALPQNNVSMIQASEVYWDGEGLQKMRRDLLEQKKTIIWYSQDLWQEKQGGVGEYFLSHPQEWWAILLTQFAFSRTENPKEAFRFLNEKNV